MTKRVVTVDRLESCQKAAELMARHRIDCLVIVQQGIPVGIITMYDLIAEVVSTKRRASNVRVEEVMSCAVHTIDSKASIFQVAFKMQYMKIKQLPVVERGRLVGIVTQTDIVHSVNGMLSRQVWILIALIAFSTFLSLSLLLVLLREGRLFS